MRNGGFLGNNEAEGCLGRARRGHVLTETLSGTGMGSGAPVVAGLGKLVVPPGNVPQLMGLR